MEILYGIVITMSLYSVPVQLCNFYDQSFAEFEVVLNEKKVSGGY